MQVKLNIKCQKAQSCVSHVRLVETYLRLDAVEATAPQHLASLQLHLSVVNLIQVLHLLQLLLRDLLALCPVTCCLQELQPASGHTGYHLRGRHKYQIQSSDPSNTRQNSKCNQLEFCIMLMQTISPCTGGGANDSTVALIFLGSNHGLPFRRVFI